MMRELITVSEGLSKTKSAEFKVGIRSLPFLADHGLQDMVVLPGSLFIQIASLAYQEIFKKPAVSLRNIQFQNPVILSDEDTVIKVEIRENNGRPVEYVFFEPTAGESTAQNCTRHFAKLEIEPAGIAQTKRAGEFSVEEFKARTTAVISAEEVYRKLRETATSTVHDFKIFPRFGDLKTKFWES